MQGGPRNWLHSWVVNQDTGLSAQYPAAMIHPKLREHEEILSSEQELATWLKLKSLECAQR
jgi:hypothetical protein